MIVIGLLGASRLPGEAVNVRRNPEVKLFFRIKKVPKLQGEDVSGRAGKG